MVAPGKGKCRLNAINELIYYITRENKVVVADGDRGVTLMVVISVNQFFHEGLLGQGDFGLC